MTPTYGWFKGSPDAPRDLAEVEENTNATLDLRRNINKREDLRWNWFL
jgi:hypothetical protein